MELVCDVLVKPSTSDPRPNPLHEDGAFSAREPHSEVRRLTPVAATARHMRTARSLFSRVPVVVVGAQRLREIPLDHRSGFLLSLLDGSTSVEELLDVSGMTTEATLAILDALRLQGIIEL